MSVSKSSKQSLPIGPQALITWAQGHGYSPATSYTSTPVANHFNIRLRNRGYWKKKKLSQFLGGLFPVKFCFMSLFFFQMWWILWRPNCLPSSQSCKIPVLNQELYLCCNTPVCLFHSLHTFLPPTANPGTAESPVSSQTFWALISVCSVRRRGWWSSSTKRVWRWVNSMMLFIINTCTELQYTFSY